MTDDRLPLVRRRHHPTRPRPHAAPPNLVIHRASAVPVMNAPVDPLTPIYAQTFADTGQPQYPWTWPWLVTDFPECSCDDEPQFCEIHGAPEWLRRYAARWGA